MAAPHITHLDSMKFILYSSGRQPINKHFLQMQRHVLDADIIGCVQENIVVWFDHGYGQWYWSEDDTQRLEADGQRLLDPVVGRKVLSDQKSAVKDYWSSANILLSSVKEKISDEELASFYSDYSSSLRRVLAHFHASISYVTLACENELMRLVNEKHPEKAEETFQVLTTPTESSILNSEQADWLRIAKNPGREDILSHTSKYSILLANVFSEDEAIEWANNRLLKKTPEELKKEITKSEETRKATAEKQGEFLDEISSEKVKYLSWFLRECSHNRLLIKACWNGEAYHLLPFFRRCSKAANCTVEDIYLYYTWEELVQLLSGGVRLGVDEICARKKYYLLYFEKPDIAVYSGKLAQSKKKVILDPHLPDRKINKVSGMVANQGLVEGSVRVLKEDNPLKIKEFMESLIGDEILVTGMTNPTIVPFMRKVKGIVTDEGGIACHAAIISREFNVPCIVGCKTATLVFKDKDVIRLDGETGIVKRIL